MGLMYNKNAGWGQAMIGALPFSGSGKAFIVGDSGTANIDMLQRVFDVDPDSTLRFFSTIDAAVGACTVSAGDLIIAMPGHTETVTAAAGLALDVAGVTVLGLGSGSDRPTVNFTTAVTASMRVSAANVTVQNVLFTGGIDALTLPVDIRAADCSLIDIETRDVTGQATDFIVTTAAADRLKIKGWIHRGATAAGADTAISIVGGDGIEIDNFDIDGNFAVSAIENVTTACTNLKIGAKSTITNIMRTRNAADVLVTCVAATTGMINNIFGRLQDNAANITEAFVMAAGNFGNNLYLVNADGERAFQFNATASADA